MAFDTVIVSSLSLSVETADSYSSTLFASASAISEILASLFWTESSFLANILFSFVSLLFSCTTSEASCSASSCAFFASEISFAYSTSREFAGYSIFP